MDEKLWFQQSVEGLFIRGIGERMTPRLRERLKARGIDLTKLLPAYPFEKVVEGVEAACEELYPGRPRAEAERELGALFMQGYAQTLVGFAMVQVMKIIGPRRSLERMQRNFRSGGNHVETRFTSLGPAKAEVWFNDVGTIPDFYAGLIACGGEFTGAKDVKVTHAAAPDGGHAFVVEWDA